MNLSSHQYDQHQIVGNPFKIHKQNIEFQYMTEYYLTRKKDLKKSDTIMSNDSNRKRLDNRMKQLN